VKIIKNIFQKEPDSSVGTAKGYGLHDKIGFPAEKINPFFSFHKLQTGSGAHPARSPVGTEGSFPEG
jgi:hypothetical protein